MAQFQFVMRSGPTPGVTFPLVGDQLTIGRDSSNAVAINDSEVSRKNSRLSFQGGKYVIEDLGSTNGTFVNGKRLTGPIVLKPGDVVSLGEQIVLMYDSINMDPGATMVAPRKSAYVEPTPVQASAAAYASSPAPAAYTPPPTAGKKANMTPIFIVSGVFLVICLCASFFWWVDATYRWCVFFPFMSGC